MQRHYVLVIQATFFVVSPILSTFPDQQSLLSTLSLEQKIGQLFMVAAVSDPTINTRFLEYTPYQMDQQYVESLITHYHVGGVIFLGSSTASNLSAMVKHFQSLSAIPLLIGLDGEWGAAMRVRDAVKWPYALTLGAITDTTLLYQLGRAIGAEYRALGIHINFAPVADINTNYDNPVIGYRSFGSDADNVTRAAIAIASGLRDAGIIGCAKHFPGHGDTAIDSHYALPVVAHTRERLDAIELQPFKHLIKAVGFSGLIITDGLGMRAVTEGKEPGQVELEALLAGNDVLLCPVHVPQAIDRIKQAINDGRFSIAQLDEHVLKILEAKAEITDNTPAPADKVMSLLHPPASYALKADLFEHAITIVRDTHAIIPLTPDQPVMHVQLGNTGAANHFAQAIDTRFKVTHIRADGDADYQTLCAQLHTYNLRTTPLIISVHGMSKYAHDTYGMTSELLKLIESACRKSTNCIVILFGNPYSTTLLPDVPCLLCGYEDETEAHDAVAKILVGTLPPQGRLPV